MLRPSSPLMRERILTIGSFGTGKTTAWLKIAYWAQMTGSDARFYVMDSDRAVKHMLANSEEYGSLNNIEVVDTYDWPDYVAALEKFQTIARPHDWIVSDFVGTTWDAVQEWYIDQIFDRDIGDFFLAARQGDKSSGLDGWKDWSVINKIYKSWMNTFVQRTDCQIYMTAVAEPIRDTDDRSVKATFGPHGVRPKGQKHLGHTVHTVLLFQSMRPGNIVVNTVKDRERAPLVGVQLNDFVTDYLIPVAGWKIGDDA